ncbi:hypothetical protein [Endozoicomonas atrinae]|uniref:hypothetical protein n=1 Tax=Endozoicomonas atrinae TaxID=1333660 RepID=UPI003AFFBF16
MNQLNGYVGAASANGIQHNGQDQDDSDLSESADNAGGVFRSSTPEDGGNQQPVANRSPNVYMTTATYMSQERAESDADEPSAPGHAVGSDQEIFDSDASDLSSYVSNADNSGLEQTEISDLEQTLKGLTVNESGVAQECYCGRDQILEALSSGLRKLDSLSATANSDEDIAEYDKAREELNRMVSDSLNFISTNRFEELNEIARGIQSWQEENCTSLEGHNFKPCDFKIPDLITGAGVQVKFGHVINGIANTGVMLDLGGGVEKVHTYLDGYDVVMDGYSLCTDMREEVCMPLLTLSFTGGHTKELPDFSFLLDGNENSSWKHLAREMDGYLKPVFQGVLEAGGSVPAGTLEEYFQSVFDDRLPEERHFDTEGARVTES